MPQETGLQLDHLFLWVEPEAAEAERACSALGLLESFRRDHPGQGTSNLCYCFDNAYLELLWLRDPSEAERPPAARTGLAARANWRNSGASPFGIALRGTEVGGALPFDCYDYPAPYLPAGRAIAVARSSDDPRRPFLFKSPGSRRPADWDDGRAGARQSAAGLAEIVGLHLDLPVGVEPSGDLRLLERGGLLTLATEAAGPAMRLSVSKAGTTGRRVLSLPALSWLDP